MIISIYHFRYYAKFNMQNTRELYHVGGALKLFGLNHKSKCAPFGCWPTKFLIKSQLQHHASPRLIWPANTKYSFCAFIVQLEKHVGITQF